MGLATGALVAFIDSDDTWNANKLEVQVDALRRCPDVGIVCSDFSALSERDGVRERSHIKSYFSVFQDYGLGYSDVFAKETEVQNAASGDRFKVYSGNIYETMVFGNLILTSTTLIRKSALDAVGKFDTSYSTLEDYDLLLRLTKMFDVAFVDMPLLLYRYNEGQLSGEKHFERLCHNLDQIFEKNLHALGPCFVEANRARIRRHRGMIQSQLGYYYANHGQKQRAAHHYRRALARGGLSVRNVGYLTICYLPDAVIAGLKSIKDAVAGRARSHGG